MGILRTDRVSGLGGANAIKGSTKFSENRMLEVHGAESNEDFRLSNGSFTIEFWAYIADTSNSSFVGLFENNPARRSWMFEARSSQALRFEWWTDGSSGTALTSSTGAFIRERWHHFAVVRNGTALNIYVDGTSVANTTTSDTIYENTIEPLTIGGVFQSGALTQDITGFISNLRIIKGEAIYTANFTPPTSELTVTSNTVVLACQSPGNILQEATGKTIVATTTSTNDAPPEASHFTPNSPVGFSTTSDVGTQFGSTFDGVTTFDSQAYFVPPGGNTRERNRGRGLIFGGYSPSPAAHVNTIQFVNIQSFGNAQDFGDLTSIRSQLGAVSSKTRAISCGGGNDTPADYSHVNTCEFVTIATTSNTTDFGDLTVSRTPYKATSNDTRGIIFGGYAHPSNLNTIDFITIATAGNATDFGDEMDKSRAGGSCSSTTRGIVAGGFPYTNRISFVTIATTGDAQDFGDLLNSAYGIAGVSNNTRGVFGGGGNSPNSAATNVIQFITMASTGDATDFGDLNTTEKVGSKGNSNSIRGIFSGGYDGATFVNSISAITIATTGDAVDFGDISGTLRFASGTSDSHGGLE
jgi:hypothetical protein